MSDSKATEQNRSSNGLFVWCLEAILFQLLVVSVSLTLQQLNLFNLYTIHFWVIVMILISTFTHLVVQITIASYIQTPFITSASLSGALKKGAAEGSLCTNFVIVALYAFFNISEFQTTPWKSVLSINSSFSMTLFSFIFCLASSCLILIISVCNAFAATPHNQGNSLFFKESVVFTFTIVFIVLNESQHNYLFLCSSTQLTFFGIMFGNLFVLVSYLIFVTGLFFKYNKKMNTHQHSYKINLFACLNAGLILGIWILYFFIGQNINIEVFLIIMILLGSIVLNNALSLWKKLTSRTKFEVKVPTAVVQPSNELTEIVKASSVKNRTQFMRSRLKTSQAQPKTSSNNESNLYQSHPFAQVIVDNFSDYKTLKRT